MRNEWKIVALVSLFCILLTGQTDCFAMSNRIIAAPNGNLKVKFDLTDEGKPVYSIERNGKQVLQPSSLGLIRSDQSFTEGLTLKKASSVKKIKDDYTMLTGKSTRCSYRANRRTYTLKNADGQTMQIIFQVSNDGVAFRYAFPDTSDKSVSVTQETTDFSFAPSTISWLHPMQPGKTGWSKTQPSYEEYYTQGLPVGDPSPLSEGWCLPALFKTADDIWVLLCDADVNENYCAVRLAQDSTNGIYHIDFPHPEEHRGTVDPVEPVIDTPFQSPWRVLIIGNDLNTLVTSTLMTDVATPCKLENTDFIKPGKAAWHWLRYSDESATLQYADSFLDFAVKMKWQYMLIDASWDQYIGYEKMAEFVKKANAKNVDVILWYNSNGPWNDAPMTPINKMHQQDVRRKEFALLQKMGVNGVKIDFFGGDKQATMKLYQDIFKDAADFGIMVNCHGTTIPRGWQRTWPNLVTMESVKGMEYCTFDQNNANQQPQHCCVLPFTRNVIGSMDFTPIVLNPKIRSVTLVTTPAFELALSVVFESGIQHFGLVPEESVMMPDYVVRYLQNVPTVWDQTHLVDGYPGKYVVMARRTADTWYIAGINGTGAEKELTLDLSFLPENTTATMITDGENRTFVKKELDKAALKNLTVTMKTNGGFTIVTE